MNDDYGYLTDLSALSTWTVANQKDHYDDMVVYQAVLAAFQSSLRSQKVEGDRPWSARRRARKVEKNLRKLVRASKKQVNAHEALRTSYAAHIANVNQLPAQRQARQVKRAEFRQQIADTASRSLNRSTTAVNQGQPAAGAPADAIPQGRTGQPGVVLRGMADVFDQQRRGA